LLLDNIFNICSISSLSAPSLFSLLRKLCKVRPVRGTAQVTSKVGFRSDEGVKIKSPWF